MCMWNVHVHNVTETVSVHVYNVTETDCFTGDVHVHNVTETDCNAAHPPHRKWGWTTLHSTLSLMNTQH